MRAHTNAFDLTCLFIYWWICCYVGQCRDALIGEMTVQCSGDEMTVQCSGDEMTV